MHNILTLIIILTPLFVGFMLPNTPNMTNVADKILSYLIILILTYIGIELAQVQGLMEQLNIMFVQVVVLAFLCISFGIVGLAIFDKLVPWSVTATPSAENNAHSGMKGTIVQVSCMFLGYAIGKCIPHNWLLPESTMTVLLMLLILMVGISLKGSGIGLKEVLVNKRGVQVSIVFTIFVLLAGVVYSIIIPDVSLTQGLALSSGFGWYSLSAIVMTDAYGAVWGSVAMLNDLTREIFSLLFIPFIMRQFPSAAVGVGGATSLDFTLPVIQQSGGSQVVPMTISFGFIINILSPTLMVFFSSF